MSSFVGAGSCVDEARRLLAIWGAWHRCYLSRSFRLGYPSSVAFVHAGEARDELPDAAPENPDAERVDRILCRLKAVSPAVFRALFCWYVLELSQRQAAEYCRCCDRVYKNRRSDGEYFVAGALMIKRTVAVICRSKKSA